MDVVDVVGVVGVEAGSPALHRQIVGRGIRPQEKVDFLDLHGFLWIYMGTKP